MALLDGKQLRDGSISLDKLQGNSGLVTFTSSATMSFNSGTSLTTADENIVGGLDVTNKNYVDSVAAGLNPKESSRVIYDGDVTGIGGYTYSNGNSGVDATLTFTTFTSYDGVTFNNGDRIIFNSSTDQFVNGIYVYGTTASFFTRATDFDGSPSQEVDGGEYSFVTEGTINADTGWVVSSPNSTATIGTTPIIWTQFSSAGVVNAGAGLTKVGTTLNVGAGTGLSASSTEVFLEDTAVSTGSYGLTNSVSTFTVDQQGRLTAASNTSIQIDPGQVNNLTSEIESVVFTDANFVDGTTVQFDVTVGDSTTAEVVIGSLTASKLDTNSQGATAGYVLSVNSDGTFAWIDNTLGDLTGVTAGAGLTGGGSSGFITIDANVENGLEISADYIGLGGTLVRNTTIDGQGFDITLGNVDYILFTASSGFDVESNFVSLDSGTGSTQILSGTDTTLSAGGDLDLLATNGVYVVGSSFSVNSVEIDPTSASNGYVLTFDGTKFSPAAVAGTGDITEVIAGDGLIGGATQGAATLTVVGGTGINVNPNDIEIDFNDFAQLAGDGLVWDGGAAEIDVNVNADSLEITSDAVRLKDTITGDRTFADSITIDGNLTVSGTATYVNTQDLYVVDNTITLNATYSGSPIPYSGVEINLGDGTYSTILYESSTGYWVGGVSGSESAIIQEAGTGLTKTGNTLSADFSGLTSQLGGAGLTANGDVLDVGAGTGITVNADDIEVNFTEVADLLQGQGLTSSSGVINVDLSSDSGLTFSGAGDTGTLQVEVDNSTITIVGGQLVASAQGDITGVTAGNGLSGGGATGFVTLDVVGATGINANANDIEIDFTQVATGLQGNGLTANAGVLDVNTGNGLTINSDVVEADLLIDGGLTFSSGQIEVSVDNSTITIVGGQLVASAQGDITGVTAGLGLGGGGATGFVNLDIELSALSGLTFSGPNPDDTLEVSVDGTTIQVNASGQLEVLNTGGQPVYTQMAETSVTTSPNTDNVSTTIAIDSTPSDYSRIQIFVNGQLQNLGDGVTTTDCYFRDSGNTTTRGINEIVATDVLYWNGSIAGFRLTTSDVISISYEV